MSDTLLESDSGQAAEDPNAGPAEPESSDTAGNTDQADPNTHSPEFEDGADKGDAQGRIYDEESGLYFGKYKDESEAFKAFKNLESENGRLRREKTPEPPESYDFNLSEDEDLKEFGDRINNLDLSEDPVMKEMEPVFKEHGITQETANEIVKTYLKTELTNAPDPAKEKEKLGDNGDEVIKDVSTFVHKNFDENERQVVQDFASTAEGVKVLHKLVQMSRSQNIPSETSTAQEDPQDLKEKARDLKAKYKGNLHGDAERQYESFMDRAIKLEMQKK